VSIGDAAAVALLAVAVFLYAVLAAVYVVVHRRRGERDDI
jgi:hypothetical protein